MKKHIKNVFIAATSTLLLSNAVFAGNAGNSETTAKPIDSSSADTIKSGADQTAGANKSSAGISQVVGVVNLGLAGMYAAKAAACSAAAGSCVPTNTAMAVLHGLMGAMSFKQAKQNQGTQYNAGLTSADTTWQDPGKVATPGGRGSDLFDLKGINPGLKGKINLSEIEKIKNQLTGDGIGGVKIDPLTGKVTDTTTGKTYDPNKLNSTKALQDAGFSAQDIADAFGAAGKAESKLKKELGIEGIGAATKENGYESGSAGALTGNTADATVGDSSGRSIASVKAPSGQIAGLSKNFNGERIGVSAENIFNMMARRYKTKEKQNSFFDPSEMVKMPQ